MRVNTTITIAAGTPVNIAVALGLVSAVASTTNPIIANRYLLQMLHGGTGRGYVMDMSAFTAGTTPTYSTSGHLSGEMAPASANAPGGSWGDAASGIPSGGPVDLTKLWVDGSHTGDTVVFSGDLRI
jgi:hypothetical protein